MGKGEGQGEGSGEGGGAGKGGDISVNLSGNKTTSTEVLLTSDSDVPVVVLPAADTAKPREKTPRLLLLRQVVHRWRPQTTAERCVCSAIIGLVAVMVAVAGVMMLHQAGLLPLARMPSRRPTLVFTHRTMDPSINGRPRNKDKESTPAARGKPETWEAKALPPSTGRLTLGPTHMTTCQCVHRRKATAPIEGVVQADDSQEIVHDTKSRWSALVDNELKKCLLLTPMAHDVKKCPSSYPWIMDRQMGALPCTYRPRPVPGGTLHYSSKVVRLVLNEPIKELNDTGAAITEACGEFKSYRVLAVFVSYYSQLRTRRSISRKVPVKTSHVGTRAVKEMLDVIPKSSAGALMNEINHKNVEAHVFGGPTKAQMSKNGAPIIVETVSMDMGGAKLDLSSINKVLVDP